MTDLEFTRNKYPNLESDNPELFTIIASLELVGHPELTRAQFPKQTSDQVRDRARSKSHMATAIKLNGGGIQDDYK